MKILILRNIIIKRLIVRIQNLVTRKLEAYSLIEISIALLIIGIITGATLKGRDLIESVRLDSVVNDFRTIQSAYVQYINSYSAIPGNDANVSKLNNKIQNGSGSGIFENGDDDRFFKHLFAVGLIDSENFKKPKIGSLYKIIESNNHPYFQLSELSDKQINLLKTKIISILGNNIETKVDNNSIQIKID